MADSSQASQWRPCDSDNDLLRKILGVLNGVAGVSVKVDSSVIASIDGKTPALGQALAVASSPVVLASDVDVKVKASTNGFLPLKISEATLTRPADTTAYAANDAVSNSTSAPALIEFQNVLPVAGGDGLIVAARCMTNQSTFTGSLRLHLFKASSPTPINDNAAHTILWANRSVRIGYIDFNGFTTAGTGSDCAITLGTFAGSGSALPVELGNGLTSLWAMVETRGAFTPASGQSFFFALKTLQS